MAKSMGRNNRFSKKTNIESAFSTNNTVEKLLSKKPEQTTNIYDRSGIYQLECPTCNMRYIGQTGRPFRTRYQEHEGLQIQQLQIQIRPTPPRKTTFNRQNGEHHERITHNGQRPDDKHNREVLHIPGNKNEQPNK